MSEELSLENAVDERIRFLSADDEREPVIPVVGSTDGFDGSDRDGFLRGNYELIVHEVLGYNVYMSVCLQMSVAAHQRNKGAIPKRKCEAKVCLSDRT